MKVEEFKAQYMSPECKWDFQKFKIVCAKCSSSLVEFNGYMESIGAWYGDHYLEGKIIVKCHDCGNALVISEDCMDRVVFNKDGGKYQNEY